MSTPNQKLTLRKKIGLGFQLIGIVLLLINVFHTARTGESTTMVIPIGLGLVIGGMFLVLRKR